MKVRRFVISDESFLSLFSSGQHPPRAYEVVEGAVPKDAKLINVRHGWPNQIEILISSEEFPEIRLGDEIPILRTVMRETR